MSDVNEVSYTIRAEDDFSAVHSKLASEYSGLQESMAAVTASAYKQTDAYKELDTELEKLLTRIDPVYRAQLRMDQGNDLLTRGLANGLISQKQYSTGLAALSADLQSSGHMAEGAAHGTSMLTREMVVLGHEAMTGNFSRMPGSFMRLLTLIGGIPMPLILVGAALGAAGYAWYEFGKRAEEANAKTHEDLDKVNADLDKEISLIQAKNQMEASGIKNANDASALYLANLQKQIDAFVIYTALYGKFQSSTEKEQDAAKLAALTSQYSALSAKMKEAEETQAKLAAHDELNKSLESTNKNLVTQIATFGQSAEWATIYKLKLQGATDSQLEHIRGMAELHDSMVQGKKDAEEYSKELDKLATEDLKAAQREADNWSRELDKAAQLMKKMESPMDKYQDNIRDITKYEKEGAISHEQAASAIKYENEQMDNALLKSQEYKDNATSVIHTLKDLYTNEQKQLGSIAFQIAQGMLGAFKNMSKGIGDSVANAIVDGASLMQGLQNVAATAAKTVISMLVQIGIQRLVLAAIDRSTTLTQASQKLASGLSEVYINSFASAAAIPMVGWAIAADVAATNEAIAIVGASAAAATGAGLGVGIAGVAHGGMDFVPTESTFLLNKGERVLSTSQNADLTQFLKGGSSGGGMQVGTLSIHILENATNAEVFAKMDPITLRQKLGQPVIDALNEMFKVGRRPDFAMQRK